MARHEPANEMGEYRVEIGGLPHTLQLSKADAALRFPGVEPATVVSAEPRVAGQVGEDPEVAVVEPVEADPVAETEPAPAKTARGRKG